MRCFLILLYAFVYNLPMTIVSYYVDGVPMLKSYRVTFTGRGNSPLISLFSTISFGRGSLSQIIIPSTLLPRNVHRNNFNNMNENSLLQRFHGNTYKFVNSQIDAHSKEVGREDVGESFEIQDRILKLNNI